MRHLLQTLALLILGNTSRQDDVCVRCGRSGHRSSQCPVKFYGASEELA